MRRIPACDGLPRPFANFPLDRLLDPRGCRSDFLADFLRRVGADTSAKYVGFKCADDYYESIDMATALHPQTLLTFEYDGERLPAKYGFPMKLRMPTKLGYKNPKHIVEMFVTNTYPGGYWVDQGYNWFGGS